MSNVTRSVGRYELLGEIGRGGMAVVYRARQTDLRREVAIKELSSFHAPDRGLAQRFVFEARLAGSLSHPNVVTVFDYFEHAGIPYIAMEYLARGSLRGYLRDLSLAQAAGVFEGLLAGLAHAEAEGIVHRDLKPENLLVSRSGQIKIADFGIARASGSVQSSGFHTATGSTVGTPAYMAPEQAMGQAVGPWTDLYAVGIIAFELFTGHTPFQGDESPMTVMYRHVNEPIPPIVSLNRAVPPGISDWVQRLLVKDTAQRSSSAATAWEELEEHVIELLGPRWRRQALLTDREAPSPEAAAATPAPAPGHPTYRTFERAEPHGRAVAGPATPPPASLPPGPMLPSLADVPVGPPTPVPGSAALPAPSPAERVPPAPYATPTSATPATPAPPARVDPSLAAPSASSVTVAPRRASPAAGSGPAAAGSAEGGTPPVRRGRVRLVAAGAGIVALAIVAAVAVTGPDAEPPSPARARAVSLEAAPLRVAVPAGWRADGDAAPEALELKGSAAAVPAGGRGQGAVTIGFASTDARNAALLSAAFRKRLTKDPAAGRQAVRDLPGGLQAYRYDDLQPRDGGAKVTVYAVPTSAGIATLACMAPTTAATCASVARTLSVRGASAFAVGPDAGYATRVDESLRSLDARLDRASAAIRAAKTAKGQAQAASVIARAYRLSRRPLTSLKLSPADVALNARLLAALHSTSAAYAALASAARRTQPKTYRAARTAVRRSQSGVATVLRRLTSSGYGPLLSARFARRAVPQLKLAARPARVVAAPFASVTPPAVLPSTVPPPAILRPSPPSSKPQPKFVP